MMRNLFLAIPLAACCAVAYTAAGAEQWLVSGRVESIARKPIGAEGCPNLSLSNHPKYIIISTDNGCGDITIKIDDVYLGANPGATLIIHSRVGEFGRTAIPLVREQVLVQTNGIWLNWSPLTGPDGERHFEPKEFNMSGVSAALLPKGEDGTVSLDAWMTTVKAAKNGVE